MLIDYKGHKIFAFSDTHGMYRRLSIPADTDILISAGDACEGFNPANLEDFFAWYKSIPANLRIFVPGNHDRIFNQEPARARNLIPGGVVFEVNGDIEFDGIKFYSVVARPYLKAPVSLPPDIDERHIQLITERGSNTIPNEKVANRLNSKIIIF